MERTINQNGNETIMQEWQYRVVDISDEVSIDPDELEGELDSLGEDGWELVSAERVADRVTSDTVTGVDGEEVLPSSGRYIFKRSDGAPGVTINNELGLSDLIAILTEHRKESAANTEDRVPVSASAQVAGAVVNFGPHDASLIVYCPAGWKGQSIEASYYNKHVIRIEANASVVARADGRRGPPVVATGRSW